MPRLVRPTSWQECPRCRYPMVRWGDLAQEPEQLWVNWNPETSFLPLHLLILGGLTLLGTVFPGAALLLTGTHHRGWAFTLAEGVGVALATLAGVTALLYRRRKRARLARTLRPYDWVCARCLHSEASSAA